MKKFAHRWWPAGSAEPPLARWWPAGAAMPPPPGLPLVRLSTSTTTRSPLLAPPATTTPRKYALSARRYTPGTSLLTRPSWVDRVFLEAAACGEATAPGACAAPFAPETGVANVPVAASTQTCSTISPAMRDACAQPAVASSCSTRPASTQASSSCSTRLASTQISSTASTQSNFGTKVP